MDIGPQLLLINIFAVILVVINIILSIFVFRKSVPRDAQILIFFLSISTAVFFISYILGINIENVDLATLFFSFSSIVLLAGVFMLNLIIEVFRVLKGLVKKLLLGFFYFTALILIITTFVSSDLFIKVSESPEQLFGRLLTGDYFFIVLIFWCLFSITVLVLLLMAFVKSRKQSNISLENKVIYVLVGFFIAGGFGFFMIPMLYGVDVNPLLFFFSGLYIIPLVYGTASRNVSEISVVLKRGLVFLVLSASALLFFITMVKMNESLVSRVPGFPVWFLPLLVLSFIVAFVMYFWYTRTDMEVLKYEFLSVVTHKFRTPLTRIKWSVQLLETSKDVEEKSVAAEQIAESAQKLVDLTDILVDASKMEGRMYRYNFEMNNLNRIVREVYDSVKNRMEQKGISYSYDFDDGLSKIYADDRRLQFALHIFFENAISYTPKGGSIFVKIKKQDDEIIFSITDSGIGLTAEEKNFLFSKFYRGQRAKLADTEGMGIGIFMAKRIIERHEGKVWATSAGPNRGSTFLASFPNAAH